MTWVPQAAGSASRTTVPSLQLEGLCRAGTVDREGQEAPWTCQSKGHSDLENRPAWLVGAHCSRPLSPSVVVPREEAQTPSAPQITRLRSGEARGDPPAAPISSVWAGGHVVVAGAGPGVTRCGTQSQWLPAINRNPCARRHRGVPRDTQEAFCQTQHQSRQENWTQKRSSAGPSWARLGSLQEPGRWGDQQPGGGCSARGRMWTSRGPRCFSD